MTTDTVSEPSQAPTTTGELPVVEHTGPAPRRRFRLTLKLLLFFAVLYYFVIPLAPDFRDALTELQRVEPWLLGLGLGLELAALYCYAPLMKAALGEPGEHLSSGRLFRIQMSTRSLSSIVPGGSAASSALGYRLMTLSGVTGPDAGFALATVGLGSAVVLNLLLWVALLVSIPIRGVNPVYGSVAMIGVIVMVLVAALVFGLMDGSGRAERVVRWIARKLRVNEERAAVGAGADRRTVGADVVRPADARPRRLLGVAELGPRRCRAVGVPAGVRHHDGFRCLADRVRDRQPAGCNPDHSRRARVCRHRLHRHARRASGRQAVRRALGVAAYRFAQFFFPILLGGILYLTLRVGPWSIERRERLMRLRDLAEEETRRGETRIDFQLRFPTRDDTGELIRRPHSPPPPHEETHWWTRWRKHDTP